MGQISVTVGERTYRLSCGDGEEGRLLALAEHLHARVVGLEAQLGRVDPERLLLMAALLVTDELFDLRVATGQSEIEVPADAPAGVPRAARKR